MNKIELITSPYAIDLRQARIDAAIVTGQELMERPYWFRNTETGQLYYDLYACLGWPTEVTNSSNGLPGYAAIVGVVRSDGSFESNPINAKFQLLAETEFSDVPTLLRRCLVLRKEYGFGVHKNLLRVWLGDPERFFTPLALLNEKLIEDSGERAAVLIAPPDDFYTSMIFDNYVRALRSTLLEGSRRFYFGYNDILRNRLREFKKDDPCVFAIGGLVYSLLSRCRWMDGLGGNAFTVEDENT